MTIPTSLVQLYETYDARTPIWAVYIAGAPLRAVISIDVSFAMAKDPGGASTGPVATITVPRVLLPAAVVEEAQVQIWQGFRVGLTGYMTLIFGGAIVDSVSLQGVNAVIECVMDGPRKLNYAYNRRIDFDFDNVTAVDSVTALLDLAGVHDYFVDLDPWDIGTATPQRIQFATYGEAVNKVAVVDGSPWYCLPSGQVRVEKRDPFPADQPRRIYFSGQLVGTTETQPAGVTNPAARPRLLNISANFDRAAVANRVEIDGAVVTTIGPSGETNSNQIIEEVDGDPGQFASGAYWIPTPPLFQDFALPNELIDLGAKAFAVAERYFALKNRLPQLGQATIPMDPDVFLGETVRIIDLDYSGIDALYCVIGYRHSISAGSFETQLELQGGAFAGTTGLASPFADFIWKFTAQHSLIPGGDVLSLGNGTDLGAKYCVPTPAGTGSGDQGGNLTPGEDRVMVTLNFRSLSEDFDGQVVAWDWSDDQGHFGTGPSWTLLIDPAVIGSIQVTLTVTDNDGRTGTITKTVYTSANPIVPGTPNDNGTMNDTGQGGGTGIGPCVDTPVDTGPSIGGPANAPNMRGGNGAFNFGRQYGVYIAAGAYAMGTPDLFNWHDASKADAGVTGDFISVGSMTDLRSGGGGTRGLFGTQDGEIWLTTDYCLSGTVVLNNGGNAILCIVWDTDQPGVVWAGTAGGALYVSTDYGASWSLFAQVLDGPIYGIATPSASRPTGGPVISAPVYLGDQSASIWVFGGSTGNLGSQVQIDYQKTGQFVPLRISGDLAAAIAKSGPGFAVRAFAFNESALLLGFEGGVSPPIWVSPDPLGDPTSWFPATTDAIGLETAAPGRELVYVASDGVNSLLTADDLTFTDYAAPSPVHQVFWMCLDGAYLAAADGGLLYSVDFGTSWGFLRPNATLAPFAPWPGDAKGHQVSFAIGAVGPPD